MSEMEKLRSQCAVMAELLRELRDGVEGEWCFPVDLDERIDAALAGNVPDHFADANKMVVPVGWQLVRSAPNQDVRTVLGRGSMRILTSDEAISRYYNDILEAAAPKQEGGA
jgi:hypothetical protein